MQFVSTKNVQVTDHKNGCKMVSKKILFTDLVIGHILEEKSFAINCISHIKQTNTKYELFAKHSIQISEEDFNILIPKPSSSINVVNYEHSKAELLLKYMIKELGLFGLTENDVAKVS